MSPGAVALLAVAQLAVEGRVEVPLPESPPVEVWASERAWSADELASLARLPGVTAGLRLDSSMVRAAHAAVLARQEAALLSIPADLKPAHVDQLKGLARVGLVVRLPEAPGPELARALHHLGPRPMRFVVGCVTAEQVAWLSGFKAFELEVDVRGRVPEQEEIARLARVDRAVRIVRLSATDSPQLLKGLRVARPARLVVESVEDRLPQPMAVALLELGVSTRVRMDDWVTGEDVRRLAALPRLSLELWLGDDPEGALRRVKALFVELARR